MKITNQYKNIKVEKNIEGSVNLALGNDRGNYLYLVDGEKTRYQGFYWADYNSYEKRPEIFKVIDEINFIGRDETDELKNNFFKLERKSKNGISETYFIPDGHSALCLKMSKQAEAEIDLDARHPYDGREMGRFYKMEEVNDCLVVEFIKRRDWGEDNLGDKKEFSLYLAVKTDKASFAKIEQFISKYYPKDHKRNSFPWDRYVYRAFKMRFKLAVFAVAGSKKKAMEEATDVFDNFEKLYKKTRDESSNLQVPDVTDAEIKMACLCAQNSIRTLTVKNEYSGAYAGLPWFFQFWHRDEALSLHQLFKLDKKIGEEIVNLQLDSILKNDAFRKQRFPDSPQELQSADALGFLARACYEIFGEDRISKTARKDIVKKFEKTVPKLLKERTQDGLAQNHANETWMDSLDRSGACIEIQAGRLALYKLLYTETDNDQYKILLDDMVKAVKERFYRDGVLWDTADSKTVRPNVFLAFYLYPELMTNEEWEKCFDQILPELYLEWGGIASLSRKDEKFLASDTGENSPSYHNGDSWYFMNNLVATSLYLINPAKYSEYINGIMDSSTKEILYMGTIGHHSEISSASAQESAGSEIQLWSSAMYLEFFDSILED